MRIIVNGTFLKRRITGVQRYAHEVTRRLQQHENVWVASDFEVTSEPRPERSLDIPASLPTKVLGSLGWIQFDLPRVVGRNDLLFSPEGIGPLGALNHVVTIHDLSVFDHPEWFRHSFALVLQFYLSRLAKHARAILVDSEFSRTRVLERFHIPEERVHVIPCAAGERFFPRSTEEISAVKERYGLPTQYILALGSLEPRKNLSRLLQAWSQLSKSCAEMALALVGSRGKWFADARLPQSGSPTRVIFTGYLLDEDLPALYSGAVGLVYPSLYEGFGLPVLEAMACGTPVITSNSTSLPEVAGDAALYIEPLEPESIAIAIQLLNDDAELRAQLSQKGLARAKCFSWDRSTDLIYSILEQAAWANVSLVTKATT